MLKKLSRGHARSELRLAAAAAVMFACVVSASGAPKKKKAPPPDDLPTQVSKLAYQLWGVPLDESGPLTSHIEKLVLDHMTQWINAHPPDAGSAGEAGNAPYNEKLRHEVESVFANVRNPNYATASTFLQSLAGKPVVGVGYTLGWSQFDRANVIAVFEASDTGYRKVAVDHFMPDVDLSFHFLQPPAGISDQLWFVAYGTRLGKSSPRLSAVVYSFDGKTLQSLWHTTDVYDGRISFQGGRVMINYLKEDELKQAILNHTPSVRHEAAYQVTPKGLEVEYDR
ncbi:MAG TPA: hypothetical protein VMT20_02480 [Terriglobia bacterium]|nr:hypothetical protein [Terriglobia bacterium]